MSMKMKLMGAVVGLAGIAGLAADASASTSFLLGNPGVTQALGTGWGTLSGQLDATFAINNNLAGSSFTLDVGGTFSQTLGFGVVTLREQDIDFSETNNLGVTYTFHMVTPNNSNVDITATGVAQTGSVSDGAVDLTIDFSPIHVFFGVGGEYVLNVSDMQFSTNQTGNNFQPVSVTYLLISDSQNVPEPMTLGLLGAGLLGMGIAARRRRS
ncbi:MAG: PEP-CTERM sorting domain-containing protein [Alphaproteobacteria bacterium]|nr:PEP-CTERM sorting domain-containing protein [Alphaproteobacteria bacterium]